jgi:hypothetical protein
MGVIAVPVERLTEFRASSSQHNHLVLGHGNPETSKIS